MARFHDCIASAKAQGALTEDEARMLGSMYDEQLRATGDHAKAKAGVADRMSAEALRKENLARMQAERAEVLMNVAEGYRGPSGRQDVLEAFGGILDNTNNRLVGVPSVTGRRNALFGDATRKFSASLERHRRTRITGRRQNKVDLDGVVDAAFNGGNPSEEARAFLKGFQEAADDLVDQFNRAGGAIQKLDSYFPQNHDAGKMAHARKDRWIEFIAPRLDVAKMRDPLTGEALSPARLRESLDAIYDRIVTDGASDLVANGTVPGRGAVANQRQEHRFLVFRDANAWREYNDAFGNGDVFAAMINHLQGLAKDTAAMQVLGPNPNATVHWMRAVIREEQAKAKLGEPSLWNTRSETLETLRRVIAGGEASGNDKAVNARDIEPDAFLGELWTVVNGGAGLGSQNLANAGMFIRNVLTSAQLGGTFLTALAGDPAQQAMARRIAGLPQARYMVDVVTQVFSGRSKAEAAAAGIIMQDATEHLSMALRHRGVIGGAAEFSRWLPFWMMNWSGLQPWTVAHRRVQATSFMTHAARAMDASFDQLVAHGGDDAKLARWFEGFGIGPKEWEMIRQVTPQPQGDGVTMLRMPDILNARPGDQAFYEVALRYSEAVHAFMEEAVPMGTARARAVLGAATKPGTRAGELTRSVTQYLTYPTTVGMSMLRATGEELSAGGNWRGRYFLGAGLLTLTVGGMMGLQFREIRNGRDPLDMNPTSSAGMRHWVQALAKGGGLGVYGDYIAADYLRGGGEVVAKLAGPTFGMLGDLAAIPAGLDVVAAAYGDAEVNRGKRAANFVRRNLPLQNIWWVKPVTDRMIFDQLDLLADPYAHRAWRTRERRLERDKGQGQWWRRGEIMPNRAPDFTTLWQSQ